MKTKRFLSILIIISMIMSFCGVFATAEEGDAVQSEPITIIHNIADKYTGESILTDDNIHWFLADLADYATVYPDSEYVMSDELRQSCLDKVIEFADNATTPGDLSKSIIALRSMGYDAKNVTTKKEQAIDIVEKLTALVDEEAAAVIDPYTLSYVIIALQQGADYATQEQMTWLMNKAIETKNEWQYPVWGGPDAVAPMVLAISPYYDENDTIKEVINEAINESIEIIKNCQTDSGLMSDSVCSTGVSMVALAAMGIDCEEVIKNGNNLIDGMMAYKTEELDGFNQWGYSFDTEQSFRGLIAWQMSNQGKRIYDFSQYPMNEAKATVDLPTPTPEPEPEPEPDYPTDEPTDTVSIKIKVMIHSEDECNNSYTYKNNSSNYTALVDETVIADSGVSVFEVLDEVLTRNHIDYVEGSSGYIVSIDGIREFDHGDRSGWMFTVDGKYVNTGSNSKLLSEDATVVWFYTDDYSREKGSENYSTSLGGEPVKPKTDVREKEEEKPLDRNPDVLIPEIKYDEKTFGDIVNHQSKTVIEELAIRGIINGMTDTQFCPDNTMTRAEFSTIVVRALGLLNKGNTKFDDVSEDTWYYDFVNIAYNYGIVEGMSESEFNPNGTITREQAATMIQRAAVLCGLKTEFDEDKTRDILAEFVDYVTISDWAKSSMAFCFNEGILDRSVIEIKPKTEITRAEVAQMVYNVLKEAELI